MAVELGSAVGYLDLNTKDFLEELKNAQSQANKAFGNISKKFQGLGDSFTKVGKTLSLAVTTPITTVSGAIIKMGSDFEAEMSKVKAISGASESDFERLQSKAKELGATTVYSASQVASGMSEMAKAGWTTEQIIDGMQGVLNAASASGEDLANVSTIVADAITGFGLEAKDATRVADLLTQAANSGTIDINDLGESFKYIAPLSASMGLNIEEVTTALAAMSQAGIKGSQAGTSLRTVLLRMVDPTEDVEALMQGLNIQISNSDGTFKSLDDIVDILRKSFSGLNDEQKAYAASVLADQEGSAGLLSLLNQTEEAYDAISDSMKNSSGIAEKTAAVMLDNLQGRITLLKSALEGLAIQFYEVTQPYLELAIEKVNQLVSWLSSLSAEEKEQIAKIAALVAAIGPALIVLGKLSSAVGSVIGVFGKFTTVLGGISAPVLVAIGALTAIGLAFANLWKKNEDFRNNISTIWEEIKNIFSNFASDIVERLNSLGFEFEDFTQVVSAIWNGFCELLGPVFIGAFEGIKIFLETTLNVLIDLFDIFASAFNGDWQGFWEGINTLFTDIWNGLYNFTDNILNTIKGVFDVFLGWFGTSWEEVWTNVKDFFVGIWGSITETASNIASSMVNIGKDIIEGIWEGIKNTGDWFKEKITGFFKGPIDWVKGVFDINSPSKVFERLGIQVVEGFNLGVEETMPEVKKTFWQKFKDAILGEKDAEGNTITQGLLDTAFGSTIDLEDSGSSLGILIGNSIANSIGISLTGWGGSLFSIGVNLLNKFASAFFSNWDTSKSIGENIVLGIWEGIKGMWDFLWGSIKGFFGGIWNGIKGIFGIHSPSKKFAYLGEMMAEGLGVGFDTGISGVIKSVKNSMDDMWDTILGNQSMQYALAAASTSGVVMPTNKNNKISRQRNASTTTESGVGGDTFIFNSPKQINEVEAARLLKKTKRDISEGF